MKHQGRRTSKAIVTATTALIMGQAAIASELKPLADPAELAFQEAREIHIYDLKAIEESRLDVISSLADTWSPADPSAHNQFVEGLRLSDSEQLLALTRAESREEVQAILDSKGRLKNPGGFDARTEVIMAPGDPVAPEALGETFVDVVYTPVQPCRVADSRSAGGEFAAGETREYYVYGPLVDLDPQGATTDCPAPKGEPVAVAINVTVVPGNAAPGGNIRVYPNDETTPNASLVNFRQGVNIANAGIIRTEFSLGPREIEVFASQPANVILDVLGYYYPVDRNDFEVKFAGSNSSSTTNLIAGGGCTNYAGGEVSITVPGPGFIKVDAQAVMRLEAHTSGTTDIMNVFIGDSNVDCTSSDPAGGYRSTSWDVSSAVPSWSGGKSEATIPVSRTFLVNSAGTYTYYLNGIRGSGSGTGGFWFAGMQAMFYPDE